MDTLDPVILYLPIKWTVLTNLINGHNCQIEELLEIQPELKGEKTEIKDLCDQNDQIRLQECQVASPHSNFIHPEIICWSDIPVDEPMQMNQGPGPGFSEIQNGSTDLLVHETPLALNKIVYESDTVNSYSKSKTYIAQLDYNELSSDKSSGSLINNTDIHKKKINIDDIKISKTDAHCWWCCHQFNNYPVSCPIKYYENNDLFLCKGSFCSFSCCLSYSSKHRTDLHLLKLLYRKLFKIKSSKPVDIKKAPPKEILKMFGGPIDINEYRASSQTLNTYNIITYPIVFIDEQLHMEIVNGNNHSLDVLNDNCVVPKKLNVRTVKDANKRLQNKKGVAAEGIAQRLRRT